MENLRNLFRRKKTIEGEVDEEFQFHLEMQAHDYEDLGLLPEVSRAMAHERFGDVEQIKKECIQIGSGRRILVVFLNSVFILSLLAGLFLRLFIPENHMNRVGDCLMMIGGLGILLVYFKQAGTFFWRSTSEPFHLGLNVHSPPVSFDEKGRTPFDRVRADD